MILDVKIMLVYNFQLTSPSRRKKKTNTVLTAGRFDKQIVAEKHLKH